MSVSRPRAAIRPDQFGEVDDVYVDDVSCFRMERMDRDVWWLCCYTGEGSDRIDFDIYRHGKQIDVVLREPVPHGVTLEPGSLGAP